MAKKASIYASVVLIVLAALIAGGYWLAEQRAETVCQICQRHIHPGMRVLADIGGHKRAACCAHCAVTEARQENKPIRLLEVTDYATGRVIQPKRAWYVEESSLVACEHRTFTTDETKHVQDAIFDRCAPGTYAFARREDAEAFIANNGGVLRTEQELLQGVSGND